MIHHSSSISLSDFTFQLYHHFTFAARIFKWHCKYITGVSLSFCIAFAHEQALPDRCL